MHCLVLPGSGQDANIQGLVHYMYLILSIYGNWLCDMELDVALAGVLGIMDLISLLKPCDAAVHDV